MDLIPTQKAITAQGYLSREDMSLLHRMKTGVITSSSAPKPNTKVEKSLNFVSVNKCDIKVQVTNSSLGALCVYIFDYCTT